MARARMVLEEEWTPAPRVDVVCRCGDKFDSPARLDGSPLEMRCESCLSRRAAKRRFIRKLVVCICGHTKHEHLIDPRGKFPYYNCACGCQIFEFLFYKREVLR